MIANIGVRKCGVCGDGSTNCNYADYSDFPATHFGLPSILIEIFPRVRCPHSPWDADLAIEIR
jgi:hypothetical protein